MEADSSSGNRDADSERLQELSEIVVELQDAPMDVRLRRRQVDILRSMPMMDEYVEAVHTLADLVMLSDGECTLISYKRYRLPSAQTSGKTA